MEDSLKMGVIGTFTSYMYMYGHANKACGCCLFGCWVSDTRSVVFSSPSSHIWARSLRLVTMATQDYNQKAV